jgi:hypothetical protein
MFGFRFERKRSELGRGKRSSNRQSQKRRQSTSHTYSTYIHQRQWDGSGEIVAYHFKSHTGAKNTNQEDSATTPRLHQTERKKTSEEYPPACDTCFPSEYNNRMQQGTTICIYVLLLIIHDR